MFLKHQQPLISILMPCKNAETYLSDCLQSITSQSISNWELIVVDDNSNDRSYKILEKWSQKIKSIICIRNTGSGIIDALRLAYSHSKGDLITRMDADDIMTTDKLKTMSEQLINAGQGYVATGKVEYFRNDKPLGNGYIKYAEWLNRLSSAGTNYTDIYKECVIPSPCWMIYREDFDKLKGFESEKYPEDYDLVFRMYMHNIKVIPCKDIILHRWRDHSERASRNDNNYTDNRFLELKVNYFIEIDKKDEDNLVLWGAGTKAKNIAKRLINKNIEFEWITNNKHKIGHNIYGKTIYDTATLKVKANTKIIVAVANPKEQIDIKSTVDSIVLSDRQILYWFC